MDEETETKWGTLPVFQPVGGRLLELPILAGLHSSYCLPLVKNIRRDRNQIVWGMKAIWILTALFSFLSFSYLQHEEKQSLLSVEGLCKL